MKEGTREYYEERILRVQMYIQSHLDEPLSLNQLADVACFSPFHFHRLFRGLVGESPSEYIRRLRLERAKLDLRYSSRPVTEIAFDSGYETHESFTRAFRSAYGASPKEFRDQHRNESLLSDTARERRFVATIIRPGGKPMEVKIETFPPLTVAFVRHVGPYKECHAAWGKLCSNPAVRKSMGRDTLAIGICYDDPDVTEPDKIRYDACVTISEDFVPGAGVEKQQIEEGPYAVLIHKGSYDGLHDTYRWLFGEWLPGSGRELKSAPSLEVYRNDPNTTPPEQLVTEIRVPLQE